MIFCHQWQPLHVCAVVALALAVMSVSQSEPASATDGESKNQVLGAKADSAAPEGDDFVNHPLADLARLVGGEWRTSLTNGSEQRDTWTWGPSKRSLTSVTTNSVSTSESTFGSFRLIYHHPQRNDLSVLALAGRGLLQTGTLSVNNDLNFRFDMTLFYDQEEVTWASEPTREISSVWVFKTRFEYTNSWVEDMGRPVAPGSVAWTYTKDDEIGPLPASAGWPPAQIEHLGAFLPYLDTAWEADATRTMFSWIPYNEAILIRTFNAENGSLIQESVIYPHPISKTIRAVTIHASGEVDVGVVSVANDAILFRSTRSDLNRTTGVEQRLEQPSDGKYRVSSWVVRDGVRTHLTDTTYRDSAD